MFERRTRFSEMRFDVVAIDLDTAGEKAKEIRLLKGAFDFDESRK